MADATWRPEMNYHRLRVRQLRVAGLVIQPGRKKKKKKKKKKFDYDDDDDDKEEEEKKL